MTSDNAACTNIFFVPTHPQQVRNEEVPKVFYVPNTSFSKYSGIAVPTAHNDSRGFKISREPNTCSTVVCGGAGE